MIVVEKGITRHGIGWVDLPAAVTRRHSDLVQEAQAARVGCFACPGGYRRRTEGGWRRSQNGCQHGRTWRYVGIGIERDKGQASSLTAGRLGRQTRAFIRLASPTGEEPEKARESLAAAMSPRPPPTRTAQARSPVP
jgi:hypothetical protein